MAAPILWTPGKNAFFLQENLHVHKILRFRGRFWGGGGGSADFIFMGARIFLSKKPQEIASEKLPGKAILFLKLGIQGYYLLFLR